MEEAKPKQGETIPQLCLLIKTEFQSDGSDEEVLEVMAREMPCSTTELAELQEEYSQLCWESGTECG